MALAVLSLAPLALSSGTELIDWLIYHRRPPPTLFSLEPLVGLDSWLHWLARGLILVGLVNVLGRRVRPYLVYVRHVARARCRLPSEGTSLFRVTTDLGCRSRTRILPASYGPVAFTCGLIRPRIYVSEGLVNQLDAAELRLLFLHENRHRVSRDPLRSLVATVLGDLFFWVPVARSLARAVILKIEFAADDAAAGDDRVGLAKTILKVAELEFVDVPMGIASFAGGGVLALRVRRLIGNRSTGARGTSPKAIMATAAVLIGLWVLGLMAFGTHNAHLAGEETSPVLGAEVSSPH